MLCLSSMAVSVLNESIRVSNAESQLAVPLRITTFFGASAISSPKGSAVWTGATAGGGAAAAGLSAGDLFSAGGGTGVAFGAGVTAGAGAGDADVAGAGVGLAAGGDCARAEPAPSAILREIAATRTRVSHARRKQRVEFIQSSPSPMASRISRGLSRPRREITPFLTRQFGFRPMTDMSWAPRRRLANPPELAI